MTRKSAKNLWGIILGAVCLAVVALALAGMPFWRGETAVAAPEVDKELAFAYVERVVAIGPRPSGSEGAKRNAELIRDIIADFGLNPQIDEWRENTPLGEMDFRNVTVELPGRSRQVVIVGGHYDTKWLPATPNFVGANDGGSSTGLMLAMIKAAKSFPEPPPYSLRFVFFDGEECFFEYTANDGLFGSRRMAKHLEQSGELDNIAAVVLLDMVGDRGLGITLPADTHRPLANRLLAIAERQGVAKHFGWYPTPIIDDHVPFQRRGVPAINLIDFDYGPNNLYWHTAADTIDKISADSLKIVGDAALALLWELHLAIKP